MKFKDDIKPSSGFGKFLHVISWPIRRFYIVIPILTLLLTTPIFFGVKVTEIKDWYKDKATMVWEETPVFFTVTYYKTKKLLGFEIDEKKLASLLSPKPEKRKKVVQKRGIDTLVDAPKRRVSTSKRKSFDVSSNEIPRIAVEVEGGEIIETTEFNDIVVYSDVEKTSMEASDVKKVVEGSEPALYVIKPSAQKLPLIYLETPKTIIGKAVIKNANELEIDNTYIVLYGIYAKNNTLKGAQARAYLETKARKNDIKCSIVAYTYQNVATAICFVGKENLNQSLVDKGYSDNIALK